MFQCDECQKLLSSKFALNRHMKTQHRIDDHSDTESDHRENQSIDGESEETEAKEKKGEIEEDDSQDTVWGHYADTAWQNTLNENDKICENTSFDSATWKSLEKDLDKQFIDAYKSDLIHYENLKHDPIHQAAMKAKQKMIKQFDMDTEEAINAAIKQRKFLLISKAPNWQNKFKNECENSTNQDE